MTTDDVKDALTNYHWYKKRLNDANLKLIEIIAKQTKAGGSIIKMPEQPTDRTHFQLECIAQKDEINHRARYWRDMNYLAEAFIRSLREPYQSMVRDKYIERLCDYKMMEKYAYESRQIRRIIKRLIERYVEQT
jgi:predicted metal-dependent phosphoesterase TrpH